MLRLLDQLTGLVKHLIESILLLLERLRDGFAIAF